MGLYYRLVRILRLSPPAKVGAVREPVLCAFRISSPYFSHHLDRGTEASWLGADRPFGTNSGFCATIIIAFIEHLYLFCEVR